MRLGVDVGGTHTDAVLIEGRDVVATAKALTTADIRSGITQAIAEVLDAGTADLAGIDAVMLGTTQLTNAVVERRHLEPTAAIRLGLPATASVPPMFDWPRDLHEALGAHVFLAHGGHHYDGSPLSAPSSDEVRAEAADLRRLSVKAAAGTSVFAPVNDASERWFADALRA